MSRLRAKWISDFRRHGFRLQLFAICLSVAGWITPQSVHGARTILTDVARPTKNEKVRRYVLQGMTDARCLIQATGFEKSDSQKALQDCRQNLMKHSSVIDVGASLANAWELRLFEINPGMSATAAKADVQKRLKVYDKCVRDSITTRQSLPLQGLAQLCAVSKTGSPVEGVNSMVVKGRDETTIVVLDFDAVIFDKMIDQEAALPEPGARSVNVTSESCPELTCNRCKVVGFSSQYVDVSRSGSIWRAFPTDEFPDGKQLPAKTALQGRGRLRELAEARLRGISPDLRLDDFWYVNDKKLGNFLCMACPLGYVSNGIDECVKDGCVLGGKCRGKCLSHEVEVESRSGVKKCLPYCLKEIVLSMDALDAFRGHSKNPRFLRSLESLAGVLKQEREICVKDPKQNVRRADDYRDFLAKFEFCDQRELSGGPQCRKYCVGRDRYAGPVDVGGCPTDIVFLVIDQIFEERGNRCDRPITASDVLDRMSGFNCAAYAPASQKAGPSLPEKSTQRPE